MPELELVCPCETFEHPRLIFNPPGRDLIAYRAGDFLSFRQALLLARPGEVELAQWRPTATADLALQMIEWWAYLADILTFYNQAIANEGYLGTADLPESVRRLVGVLGYRPRPGIGAQSVIAALSSSPKPFTLPAGFQIQSKPGPGKQPQIFELGDDTIVNPIGAIAADPPANPALLSGKSVLLKGTVGGITEGDRLLLLPKTWNGTTTDYALVTVQSVAPEDDARGKTNTRVTFTSTPSVPNGAQAAAYRLLKATQTGGVWTYPTGSTAVIDDDQAELAAIVRSLQTGDPVLFEAISPLQPTLVSIDRIQEVVWYANGKNNDPEVSPDPEVVPPIPIPHTRLRFTPMLDNVGDTRWDEERDKVKLQFGWQPVGEIIAAPAAGASFGGSSMALAASPGAIFPVVSQPVLVEDGIGDGILATGTVSVATPASISLIDLPDPAMALTSPLRVLFNLLNVSRGQSVSNEVLGSGDARVAGQEFTLKKSPLTYLLSADSTSGESYSSTLRVWVAGTEWKEVASFYEQPANARVFVTREDDEAKTHVLFGDGVNGARLPSSANNVVASYRYGSGKDAPEAGALNVILKPYPGLKSLRNPLAAGGGADPDPPEQIRTYAPRSVLTFGRAISGDDYEVIAAQTPGVTRARAYWSWDAAQQRTLVIVYVGDDAAAVAAAKLGLATAIDPNRPVKVLQASARTLRVNLTLRIAPDRVADDVVAGVTAALIDPDAGLFGANAVRIGGRIYDSEVYESCLKVAGAAAVHDLEIRVKNNAGNFVIDTKPFHDPGEGGFFQLDAAELHIVSEVLANVS
jgi:hypothetical protein